MNRASVTQLGYLGLAANDLDVWEAFARDVLGLQTARENGVLYLRMDEHQYRFAVHAGGEDDLAYVGWEVADEAAFEQIIGRLQHAGVAVERAAPARAQARKVEALATLRDPSGLATELFFGPLINAREPFVPA